MGCEKDLILELADQYGIPVVEDNAHGLFGSYRDRYLGTFGKLATQSFHETKNFTCGDGGALLINDPEYIERAEVIRENGTNRSRFFRGQVNKYSWVDIDSNFFLLTSWQQYFMDNWKPVKSSKKNGNKFGNIMLFNLSRMKRESFSQDSLYLNSILLLVRAVSLPIPLEG